MSAILANPPQARLMAQAPFVSRLQQPRPKRPVHFECSTNDLFRGLLNPTSPLCPLGLCGALGSLGRG